MTEHGASDSTEGAVKRSEWIATAALAISVGSMLWTGGVVYGQVQDHDRRILAIESEVRDFAPVIAEIRADVKYLRERAQEDREIRGNNR